MKILKKMLAVILIISMFTPMCISNAALSWDSDNWWDTPYYRTTDGRHMPWRPADKYVSVQNPPDFTWPFVNSAVSYDLIVCSDEGLTDIKYQKTGLTENYYCFNEQFETGVDYYWAVKYYTASDESTWSEPRRFRIDPDAVNYNYPGKEALASKVIKSHPRVLTTPDTLDEFRNNKNISEKSKSIYDTYVSRAELFTQQNQLPEEVPWNHEIWYNYKQAGTATPEYEAYLAFMRECKTVSNAMIDQVYTSAFAYLLTGDEEIGQFAKRALLELSSWSTVEPPSNPGPEAPDPPPSTTSYAFDDQVHREIAYKSAMAYDWLYNILTEEEKQTVEEMVKTRTEAMTYLLNSMEQSPYDSHGWTNIGYIIVISYAMLGEFEEAEEWFETSVNLYATIMYPYTYQDGGWSQGTTYWVWSCISNKKIMDLLSIGGVVDLYDKAAAVNETKWILYAYPKGSYGSFGDESNQQKAETFGYIQDTLAEIAYFADDPVALWLCKDMGELTSDIPNYYTSTVLNGEGEAPDNYPLGYAFTDIGWGIMTNTLTDSDEQIQMTFKSSPYGSYNHSHADQNSFIIQAFGEKLAIKGGYYDYYHSPHDMNITRATFAHNSVTYNGGYGQLDDDFSAGGELVQFVNHLDFDSLTGAAASAYKSDFNSDTNIDRFDRNMIYIRPDVFLVIDDLDAKGDTTASFDWWLNAEHAMSYTENSALISEGQARLKADVLYPQNVTSTYYDEYVEPVSGETYIPSGSYADRNVQTRIAFSTPEVQKTKMIVSMSVYKDTESAKEPEVTYYDTYAKLVYPGGTTVLVNLQDKDMAVEAEDENITFTGTAVTYTDESIMLTNGTHLEKDGVVILNSDKDITAAVGLKEISISGNDDFAISLNTANPYFELNEVSDLTDSKGRFLSSAVGIETNYNAESDIITFSAQKGNYTILNGGEVSPGAIKAENVMVQKASDDKAALFWDMKPGRSYDVKVDDTVYENVTSMPFEITLTDDVYSLYVKEKIGTAQGEWSDPVFIAKNSADIHDSIRFYVSEESGKSFINAETMGYQPGEDFKLYLAQYDENGRLIDVKLTEKNDTAGVYEASLEKADTSTVKAFAFGNNLKPITAAANYESDSTDLEALYIDGEKLEAFSNEQDEYSVNYKEPQLFFPFVSAVPKDNATSISTEYEFNDDRVKITVKSQQGRERVIAINFTDANDEVHFVSDTFLFLDDTGAAADKNGNPGQISLGTPGSLKYSEGSTSREIKVNLYTNMHANQGGDYYGSRVFSDRPTNDLNYMEILSMPEKYEGLDYFVFPNDTFFYTVNNFSDISFSFGLEEEAEVYVVTRNRMPGLVEQGFEESSETFWTKYMNQVGPEDKYYNIHLRGLPESDLDSNNQIKYYERSTLWSNVSPIEEYVGANYEETYQNYIDAGLKAEDFEVTTSVYVHNMVNSYLYKKTFPEGTVEIDFPDVRTSSDYFMVFIAPRDPKPFYKK